MKQKLYLYPFGIVDERCKYDNTQNQEKNKEHEFLGRGSKGLDKNFQARRVSGQFEQPDILRGCQLDKTRPPSLPKWS